MKQYLRDELGIWYNNIWYQQNLYESGAWQAEKKNYYKGQEKDVSAQMTTCKPQF